MRSLVRHLPVGLLGRVLSLALTVICVLAFALVVGFLTRTVRGVVSGSIVPRSPIIIDGDGAFTAANGVTSGSGTAQDPYVIAGWDISAAASNAIYIHGTNAYFIIRDVYLHSGLLKPDYPPSHGLVLDTVSNGRVENATFADNWIDVTVSGSNAVVLTGNRHEGSHIGITYQTTTGLVASGNVMVNMTYGFQGIGEASIVGNRITGGQYGLYLSDHQGTVAANQVEYVASIGLQFLGTQTNSESSLVFGNNLSRDWIGIRVWTGTVVKLFHNNFLYDRLPAIDDRQFGEYWDDGYPSGGNYWTDYGGVDRCSGVYQDICPNPDGIGDTPYLIDWDSRDYYPLMKPFIVPNRPPIVGLIDVTPSVAIAGEDITFRANVTDPDGDVLSFTWDFGDGVHLTGTAGPIGSVDAIHSFGSVGTFSVTLTVDDGRGGRTSASTQMAIPVPGLLRVRTSVDRHPDQGVPGTIVVDGVPRNRWGLDWLKIAPGTHTVSFTDVPGFRTPGPTVANVQSGVTTEVVGTYAALGWLRVMTSPAAPALIAIDGIPRTLWGLWMSMPAGTYNVSVGPNYQVVQVVPESTTVAVVSSVGAPQTWYAYLAVIANPAVPTQISVDGIPRNDWEVQLPLPAGDVRVATSDVPGYASPEATTVYVYSVGLTGVNPQFQRLGLLRVTTNPALPATVFVDGRPANDWNVGLSIVGTHKVSFGPVPGYSTPFGQLVSVAAGAEVSVTGVYVATGFASAPSVSLGGSVASVGVALVAESSRTRLFQPR